MDTFEKCVSALLRLHADSCRAIFQHGQSKDIMEEITRAGAYRQAVMAVVRTLPQAEQVSAMERVMKKHADAFESAAEWRR